MRPTQTVSMAAAGVVVLTVSACTAAQEEAVAPAEVITEARRLDLDGRHAEAVALYREALERAPDSFDAHYGIARALDLVDRYDEAQQHFEQAIELAPDGLQDQALRMMALSHTFARDLVEAAAYFEQVFDRRVSAENFAAAADVANELGRVHLELGSLDEAARWYRLGYETAARQDGRPPAQIDLTELRWAHAQARIAARRGDEAEARQQEAVVRGLLEKGNNPDQQIHYPYLRGYIDFHLGNYEEAISALREADREDPFILMLLGQALERAGRPEDAQQYYRDVLASPSHGVTNAIARPWARQRVEPLGGAVR